MKEERLKRLQHQQDVNTFCDSYVGYLMQKIRNGEELAPEEEVTYNILEKIYNPSDRYQTWGQRINFLSSLPPSDPLLTIYDQGVKGCMTWKGRPLFKTTTDLAILNMLVWDIMPDAIIEIGSGDGTSARYIQDIYPGKPIISFDIKNLEETLDQNIKFLYADCNRISTFSRIDYNSLPHPWLIIEDAHVNVFQTVSYFLQFGQPGDVLFLEDSTPHQEDIKNLISKFTNLRIDTYYVDFFGPNNTSAKNSILTLL